LKNFHLKENGTLADLFRLVTYLPAREFARLLQKSDQDVRVEGLHGAALKILHRFVTRLEVRGYETPTEGPLLLAANHPGGTDPFVLSAAIDRQDLHIVSLRHDALDALPNIGRYLIYLDERRANGYLTIRNMMRVLKEGAAVLIYPGGDLELDPALFPNGENVLREWSKSIALLLSRMPEVILQPIILRGTISRKAWESKLTRLSNKVTTRLQIAMIYQIAIQQLRRKAFPVETVLLKGAPMKADELDRSLSPARIYQEVLGIVGEMVSNDPAQYPVLETWSL
jgi:hypothetical protein